MNEQLKKSPFWPGRRDQHDDRQVSRGSERVDADHEDAVDGHRPLIGRRRRRGDAEGAA